MAVPRASQDNRPGCAIMFGFFQGVAEDEGDGEVDRVESLRAVQRD
jgi:hypothetical protein